MATSIIRADAPEGYYLRLPGETGDSASTPDAAALDITGDIDIRVEVAPDDWTPGAATVFLGKWTGTGNQRSYRVGLAATNDLQIAWSTDGTSTNQIFQSKAWTPPADGNTKWVRFTLDVDNGSSQYVVTFYDGDDGVSWNTIGSSTVSGTTSIHSGTQDLFLGSLLGTSTNAWAGKLYRAQVYDGIDGTLVFDADFTAETPGTTSFSEDANSATVTINQSGDPQAEIVGETPFAVADPIDTRFKLTIPGDAGTFAVTGSDVFRAWIKYGDTGSFSVTGTDATFTINVPLAADAATFLFTGTAAGLLWNRPLSAEGGTFLVTGTDATLAVVEVVLLDAATTAFTIAGTAVTFSLGLAPGAWEELSDVFAASWLAPSTTFATGNTNRFIDADPLPDGSGGLDFNVTASTENPAVVTTTNPIQVTATNRENPA